MEHRLEAKLVLGWLALWPIWTFGQQTGRERAVPITVIVDDHANVKVGSLAVAKQVVIRILSAAGFAVTYINIEDALSDGIPLTDSSQQVKSSCSTYLTVVITPHADASSNRNDAGLAAVTAGPYRRAYVFFDRVKEFSEGVTVLRGYRITGTVLGHVIVHELGHLLMPGKPHTPFGIMRGVWDPSQWEEAASGLLLFNRRQAEIMRNQIHDHCSTSFGRERRPC